MVSQSGCPSALVRDGKLAKLFFSSFFFLRPKKGGKNHRGSDGGFPSNVAPRPYEGEKKEKRERKSDNEIAERDVERRRTESVECVYIELFRFRNIHRSLCQRSS